MQQVAELGGTERLLELDREQGFDLVEDETAVAVGAGDQRFARFGRDRKRAVLAGNGRWRGSGLEGDQSGSEEEG